MRIKLMVLTAVMMFGLSGLVLAQMEDKAEMMKDKNGMMGEGMGMRMMMGHSMMDKPSMVSVGNGVVVLLGHKLYKYDNNLNLVKEAEIKMEDMGKKGKCKMCEKKMKGMDDKDNDGDDDKGADEHAAHHPKK